MPDYSKKIIYLSKAQYQELVTNESITVDGVTINYNENDIYVTPQDEPVTDVQVNGTSVVNNGVANVSIATKSSVGVIQVGDGLILGNGGSVDPHVLNILRAADTKIKAGSDSYNPIVPGYQHKAVYYGLAKLAGADMASASGETIGVYPAAQKSAISDMLNAPETVSGTTPTITAKSGVRYICGECSTLSITAPESGCIDVTFQSGSTPTVLTVSSAKTGVSAIKWANGFDPTSLEANTTYEVNILDGEFGVVGSWT